MNAAGVIQEVREVGLSYRNFFLSEKIREFSKKSIFHVTKF